MHQVENGMSRHFRRPILFRTTDTRRRIEKPQQQQQQERSSQRDNDYSARTKSLWCFVDHTIED